MNPFWIKQKEKAIPQCQIHLQPSVLINPDKTDIKRPFLCATCLSNLYSIDNLINENENKFNEILNNNKSKIDNLNKFKKKLESFYDEICLKIKKIIALISNQIEIIDKEQMKFYQLFEQSPATSISYILEENEKQNNLLSNYNEKVLEGLNNLKTSCKINPLIKNFFAIQSKELELKYEYQQISKTIKQEEYCWAIDVNYNNSVVIAGCKSIVKVFKFQHSELKQVQLLDGHQQIIQCLKFFKKTKQFISGCCEGRIIIWRENDSQGWVSQQTINEHEDRINQIQINCDEDQFISCSNDKSIKFWKIEQNKWICTQKIIQDNKIQEICLNNINSQLVARVFNCKEFQLLEKIQSKWVISQTIKLPALAIRIQFIKNDQLAVQLFQNPQLLIFNFDKPDNQFKQLQVLKVKYGESDCNLFPMQYIQSKGILINKNCQYINVIQRKLNGQFTLSQTIDFGSRLLYGCASEDGEFLFTWDKISEEIQVRRLGEME